MKINQANMPQGPLYHFFEKDDHANDFINGEIRLGWLKKYHPMEGDVREDSTESTSQHIYNDPEQLIIILDKTTRKKKGCIRKPGITNISSSSLNEFYILCTSEVADGKNIAELRERFKHKDEPLPRYAIIHDIKMFTEMTAQALELSEYSQYIMGLKWFKVEYSKGQEKTTLQPPVYLEVYQKPASNGEKDFTCEHEWRLAACIKHKILIKSFNNGNNVMFVNGEERLRRIAKYVYMDVKDLTPEILQSYGEDGPEEAPLWIETIAVNHADGLKKCAKLFPDVR
jgi:hypothetical protein